MKPLLSVALHDREELVGPCLESIRDLAGVPFELAICADGCTFDPGPYLEFADYADVRPVAGGHAVAINTSLRHRKQGQHFMTIDSDLRFTTDGWLAKMLETLGRPGVGAVSPVLPGFHGQEPGEGTLEVRNLPVGARLFHGEVVDALGYLRVYGRYGCEDIDYDERILALGRKLVYDRRVVVEHPGIPSGDEAKRRALEDCLPCFKQMEQRYRQGLDLHEAADGIDAEQPFRTVRKLGLRLDTTTYTHYGTHLALLRRAVEATSGPILEVGTGLQSTPYLHALDRPVVSVEANEKWLRHMRSVYDRPGHEFVRDLPQGYFDVALVDNEPELRVSTIEQLRHRVRLIVLHDAELPELRACVESFPFREEDRPEDRPWTAVLSMQELPWTLTRPRKA